MKGIQNVLLVGTMQKSGDWTISEGLRIELFAQVAGDKDYRNLLSQAGAPM
jgi:hypothetical protein